MFCPKCRYEYKKGITVCPDCDVKLVANLPPKEEEHEDKYGDLVTVYETSDRSRVLIAKSLLEDSGIEFFAQGNGVTDLFGASQLGFQPVAGPVRFKVREEDEDHALEVLVDMMDTEDDEDGFDDDDYEDENEDEDEDDDDFDLGGSRKKFVDTDDDDLDDDDDYIDDEDDIDYVDEEEDRY
nr:DUF2007 domain-containing protein [candidate division Zixibacteria bacterium]